MSTRTVPTAKTRVVHWIDAEGQKQKKAFTDTNPMNARNFATMKDGTIRDAKGRICND